MADQIDGFVVRDGTITDHRGWPLCQAPNCGEPTVNWDVDAQLYVHQRCLDDWWDGVDTEFRITARDGNDVVVDENDPTLLRSRGVLT